MLRLTIISILILFSSACSRTEIVYRNADWLLERYARRTVDASAAQRDQWRPVLENTLQRHRELELPLIIAYLDGVRHSIREAESSIVATCLVDGALLLLQRHARLAIDLSVPLLAGLNAEQISHLAEYMAQRQQNTVERYLNPDPQQRQASRQERFIDRIERWTGKLDDNQQQQVRRALERIPDLTAHWLTHRAQQTDRLLAMLKTGANAEALRDYLNRWWVELDNGSAEYYQRLSIAKDEFHLLLQELHMTLTNRQRATIEDRLGDLRNDLASLFTPSHPPVNRSAMPVCASMPA